MNKWIKTSTIILQGCNREKCVYKSECTQIEFYFVVPYLEEVILGKWKESPIFTIRHSK